MRLVGRGHEAIRATHTKTLELCPAARITARATCVVAVSTARQAQRMAGPVDVAITAGGESFSFQAQASSSWDPGGSAIIRRGPLRLPGTLATRASASAADLPRSLAAALRDPSNRVDVTLQHRPGEPCVVLFAADPAVADDPRLAAEVEAADLVVAEDEAARRLVGCSGTPPARIEGRVLVVATEALPGATVPRHAVAVQTVGLAPPLAAAAAGSTSGPLTIGPARHAADLLQRTPAAHRLVLDVDRRGVDGLLDRAAALRGATAAVLVQPFGDPCVVRVGEPVALSGAARVWVCFGPADGRAEQLDPAVRSAIEGLLADGVPTRTAARSLGMLTGWPHRRAYEQVVGWRLPHDA